MNKRDYSKKGLEGRTFVPPRCLDVQIRVIHAEVFPGGRIRMLVAYSNRHLPGVSHGTDLVEVTPALLDTWELLQSP